MSIWCFTAYVPEDMEIMGFDDNPVLASFALLPHRGRVAPNYSLGKGGQAKRWKN